MAGLLLATTDILDIVRSSAATIDTTTSFADNASGAVTVQNPEIHNYNTAATNTIVAAPGSGVRNVKTALIRNKDAALSCDITVRLNRSSGGTIVELHKVTLAPGEVLEFIEGVGFFKISNPVLSVLKNASVAQQGAGFAADTYLVGSSITIPGGYPLVGTKYKLAFDVTKTGAGTATPIVIIRTGTAGTTADGARCTFTFGAGTAAVDQGIITIVCSFRTVGAGTTAVLQGYAELKHQLASTGLTNTGTAGYAELNVTSAGFDSTPAGTIIGASYNGGTSASHTIQLVHAELLP